MSFNPHYPCRNETLWGLSPVITAKTNKYNQIFCTVDSESKSHYLTSKFNIPTDHIFNYKDAGFLLGIMAGTQSRGVDVVLNSLSDEFLSSSWKCVAEFGTFIELGIRKSIGKGALAVEEVNSNRTYVAVDLLHLSLRRPKVAAAILQRAINFWREGNIQPIFAPTKHSATQIAELFREMQLGQPIGKVVVSIPDSNTFSPEPTYASLQLRADRSYLFVGGLGGLGRAIATWLAEKGATEIVFLSRSAGRSLEHNQFVKELATLGCTARLVAGNVASYPDVIQAIKASAKPVGGILQASLILRDSSFLNMKWEDWLAASQPKIQGTWNLHSALLEEQSDIPLDFFFLFSSTAATGGWYGQANYHAGNTFVESFAAYRHKLGLTASVLNVGFIKDAGFVAENTAAAEAARSMGQWFNSEAELLECIELMLMKSRSEPTLQLHESNDHGRAQGLVQKSLLAMGMRATVPVTASSCRIPWRKDRRMLAYRNFEAHELKASPVASSGSSSHDDLSRFIRESGSNLARLQATETAAYLGTEMGKALFEFIMRPDTEVNVEAPLASIGLDSLVGLELKSWIRRWMGVELSTLEILNCATLQVLGGLVQGKLVEKYQARV